MAAAKAEGTKQLPSAVLVAIPLFECRKDLPRFEEVPDFDHDKQREDVEFVAFRRSTLQRIGNDPIHCAILLSLELWRSGKEADMIDPASEIKGTDPLGYCNESFLDTAYGLRSAKLHKDLVDREDWDNVVRQLSRRVVYLSCEHPYVHYANRIVPTLSNTELVAVSDAFSITKASSGYFLNVQKHLLDMAAMQTSFYAAILKDMTLIPQNFSCFPTAQLQWPNAELVKIYDDKGHYSTTIMPILDSEDRDQAYQQRTGASCQCTRCRYEVIDSRDVVSQDLARFYMTRGDLKAAKDLYEAAISQATESSQLDIQHALGAIALANGNFMDAQRIWREAITTGGKAVRQHAGLQLQREKMEAYTYFKQQPSILSRRFKEVSADSILPGAFVAQVLDLEQCRKTIEQVESHDWWTTGRHHAVPTRDVPIHTIPDLLEWFQRDLMESLVNPLLVYCFSGKQFYVHDAFLVKYEATSISNYLALRKFPQIPSYTLTTQSTIYQILTSPHTHLS